MALADLEVVLSIEESPDGSYFTLSDITGDYNAISNPGGWEIGLAPSNTYSREQIVDDADPVRIYIEYNGGTYYYQLDISNTDVLYSLEEGIDLSPSDLAYASGSEDELTGETEYPDGVYEFTFNIDTDYSSEPYTYTNDPTSEGFASIIIGEVIREALNYRIYLDYKSKDEILEKVRLLNNLYFSSQIGSTTAFSENLEQLQLLM